MVKMFLKVFERNCVWKVLHRRLRVMIVCATFYRCFVLFVRWIITMNIYIPEKTRSEISFCRTLFFAKCPPGIRFTLVCLLSPLSNTLQHHFVLLVCAAFCRVRVYACIVIAVRGFVTTNSNEFEWKTP